MSPYIASASTFRDTDIFLHELRHICREELVAVIAHRPTAHQPSTWANGARNLLIVLQDARLELLQELRPLLQRWWRSHRLSPQCLGYWELLDAGSALALPLARTRQAYTCLWGEDLLQDVNIPWEHLRLAIEQQAREVLLWFRQTYLRDSLHLASFRAFLAQALHKLELLAQDAQLLGLNPQTTGDLLISTYHLAPACLNILHDLDNSSEAALTFLATTLEDELTALAGRLNHLSAPHEEERVV